MGWQGRLGPRALHYNLRSGVFVFDVPGLRSWRWTSRTRAQRKRARAATAKAHAAARTAAKQRRERDLYGDETQAGTAAASTRKRAAARRGQQPAVEAAGPAPITPEEYAALTPEQRQDRARQAGACGARTRDGSPCMNPAGCTIPSHVNQPRRAAARSRA